MRFGIHVKLKLVSKLNEFDNPIFKLFLYVKKDLERASKQMNQNL